jgi:hypothetical protein
MAAEFLGPLGLDFALLTRIATSGMAFALMIIGPARGL